MSKKNLFEDNLQDSLNLKNSFLKGIQDKSELFNKKSGRMLFELQKTYKGDERFKLDERFMDDINQDLLPESALLNLDQNVQYDIQNYIEDKHQQDDNLVDESWGIINNEDELWREKSKYYLILEKVLGQEIFKVKKRQKFVPVKRYDPNQTVQQPKKPQKTIFEKVKDNFIKNSTIQPINQKQKVVQPKKKKIKKKEKKKNNQIEQNQQQNVQQTYKKTVKIDFNKLKQIKKDNNEGNDFKLFSQLIFIVKHF